jgi:flagellar biosynthesis/type III secretory pathway chaperone
MNEVDTMDSPTPAFTHACVLAQSLEVLLEEEFEQLKQQDLDSFDAQQDAKSRLLNELMQLAGLSETRSADDLGPEWDPFKDKMRHCRDLHRRNEILIHRKIDAIRGALQSLQCEDPASSVEIYDRLGKVSRRQRSARGYADV